MLEPETIEETYNDPDFVLGDIVMSDAWDAEVFDFNVSAERDWDDQELD